MYARVRRLDATVLLALLSAAFIALIYGSIQFRELVGDSRTASSDNRLWVISRTEVEHSDLLLVLANLKIRQNAVQDGTPGKGVERLIDDLSVHFDIFYSRVSILNAALSDAHLPDAERADLLILTQGLDRLADLFDAMNPYDPVQVRQFEEEVIALAQPLKRVIMGGLRYFVQIGYEARRQEVAIWKRSLLISVALMAIMVGSILICLRLQKKLGRQLSIIRTQNANIRLINDATIEAVIVTNHAGEIQLFNPSAEEMFGYAEADAIGQNIADMMVPHHLLDKHRQGMERYRKTGKGAFVNQGPKHTTALNRDGTEFPVELALRSEIDPQGNEIFIAFLRDISEQLAHEEKLREARDEAQRHAAAKTMFLATMSHEIRTPLHGLLASLDLINDRDIDDEAQVMVQTARSCGLRTLHQINDVLELTEVGEVLEPLGPFFPVETVSDIVDEMRALAQDRGNRISLDVTGASAEDMWLGRPKTLGRVMYNLIGNALKFTQDGLVTISLDFDSLNSETHAPTERRLRISVKDTGIGISPEDQVNLFDLFFKARTTQKGPLQDSTGLGLPIAHAAIQKLGGTLVFESQLGVGSTFSFDIPLKAMRVSQTSPSPQDDPLLSASSGLRCLVVDDNLVNLDLTAQMLRRLGCDVVTCDSGEMAVVRAALEHFDIILLDLNMPGGISGKEAADRIRMQEAAQGVSAPTVIFALTADTTFDEAALAQSRMDRVLHKPVQLHHLQQALFQLFSDTDDPSQADPKQLERSEPFDDTFRDLFDLIGHKQGGRILNGVLGDIEAALNAIRRQEADAADHLHRAIGSTAAVGLLEFSRQLHRAEDLARAGDENALVAFLETLEEPAGQTRAAIRKTLATVAVGD